MKNSYIKALPICLLVASLNVAAQSSKPVTIRGTVKNFSSQIMIEDISDLGPLLPPNSERMFVPGPDGSFRISFKVPTPNYYRLGRNILYLSAADDLVVNIDNNAPEKGEFKGKGGEANLYLRNTPFPHAGSYMNGGKNAKPSARETVDFIFAEARSRQSALDKLKGVTAEFKRLETARIKADTVNSLLGGRLSFYEPRISKDALKIYEGEYKTRSEAAINGLSSNFVDASLMKLDVYREIVDRLARGPSQHDGAAKINDWSLARRIVNSMNYASDKAELKKLTSTISAIKTPQYRDAVTQRLDVLLKFGKGDAAINFSAVDLDGNAVDLNKLKGKVIYVDVWATWCGPCSAQMPSYEKLKQKYKDNSNVAFVSLSIDDDAGYWKKNVAARKADGIQWLASRNKLLDYNVVGIPRAIIIDKLFHVADLYAPSPSPAAEKMINDLLK